jgi:hypothetical protein
MQRGDQGLQLRGGEELDLVEQEDHTRLVLGGRFAEDDKQIREILPQITEIYGV